MSKKTKLMIVSVAAAAALVAGSSVYGVTAALAGPHMASGTTQSTTNTTAAVNPATTQELRTQILEMLKNHMGLTGAEAEQTATSMAEQMQKNGITDASEMLRECNESHGMTNGMTNGQGGSNMMNGMMNGQGGSNMMNGMMNGQGGPTTTDGQGGPAAMDRGTHESHHQ